MIYTVKNISSAFEATGIWPLNSRRVLNIMRDKDNPPNLLPAGRTSASASGIPIIPRTPYHGISLASHTRRTVALFQRNSPSASSSHQKTMVEKLALAAERATAENVILREEVKKLRSRGAITSEIGKTKSRKVLSKALIVTVEDVIPLREADDKKETEKQAKKERANAKKIALEERKAGRARIQKPTRSQLSEREENILHDGEEGWEEASETMSQEGGSEAEDYHPAPRSSRATLQSTVDGELGIGMGGLSLDEDQRTRRVLRPRN